MEETADRFYVRRTTGELVGPISRSAIAGLLQQGKLDGTEEVSPDRRRWQPLAQLISPAAAQKGPPEEGLPAGAAGPPAVEGSTWGERDLGAAADLELAPLDSALGQPFTPPEPGVTDDPEVARPPGLAPVDLESLGTLELEGEHPAPPPVAEPPPAGSAAAPSAKPGAPRSAPAPAAAGARALSSTLEPPAASLEPMADADASPLTGFETAPSTGLTVAPAPGGGEMVVTAGAPLPTAAAPLTGAAAAAALRGRTLTAAKPRAEEPPKKSRKPLIIGGAAVLLVGAVVFAFLAFDLGDLVIREPPAAKVLGDDAAQIASDRFPAYQRGATRLLDEVDARPRSAALRAAAAELLAASVVLHRADRARTARADAALAEIPPRPIRSAATAPTVARARAWIALAKGRSREAGRVMDESAALNDVSPERQLLAGWVALGLNKAAAAQALFQQGAAQFPTRVAFRYGLARAQEDDGRPQAAATYKDVLAASPGHFGAALGLIRTGGYPPPARLALANRLVADNAANASPAALAEAYAIAARAQSALGKTADATALLDKALAKDPASPAALVATGEALLAQGRLHDAVAKFSMALPSVPSVPVAVPAHELRFALAAVLIEGGRRPEGLALLGAAPATPREAAATDPRASFWRGRAAELQSPPDLTAAARAYEETLSADPRFVPASLQLGALLLKQNRTAEALAVLKRAQAAGLAPATLQVALGQAQLTAGDAERARKTFKDVLAASPKDAPARLGLASALEAGHDRAAARRELESLLADSPDLPGLRPRLAELLVAAGDRDKALSLYQAEIDAGKASLGARLAGAKLAFEMGRKPLAQALLEKLTAEAPQTPGALLWLGKVRLSNGDVAGALADLRRALSFESTPDLHYEHGRALAVAGSEEKALSEYEQAGPLPPAMVARGRILLGRGDTDHSVPILEAAVKQAPDNGEGWLLLGNAYDRQGAPAKAVAAWKSAVRATPDNAEVHYHIGRSEMDQGQPASAVVHLRQAAAKAPAGSPTPKWLADLYYQLGIAEKAKGSRTAAVTALKKYLTLAPPDAPSRHEVEQQLASLGALP